jgi:hypothetical protein
VTFDRYPSATDLAAVSATGVDVLEFRALPMVGVRGTPAQIELLFRLPGVRAIYNRELRYFLNESVPVIGADRVSVELGATGAAFASEAHVTQAAVNAVIARDAHVEQSLVQTVVAANVRFERPTAVVFLVARKVEGEVRAILDWRGALVFGAAAGFVMSLFRRRR